MKTQSTRQKKVAELIKLSLSEIFKKGKWLDQRLVDNLFTITKTEISPDLKIAKCYFMPFPNCQISIDDYLDAFKNSNSSIRKQVTEKINLKFSPDLKFFYDYGSENLNIIESLLLKVKPN